MEHTYQLKNMYCCAPSLCWSEWVSTSGVMTGLGVTVHREPACPAALHPKRGSNTQI